MLRIGMTKLRLIVLISVVALFAAASFLYALTKFPASVSSNRVVCASAEFTEGYTIAYFSRNGTSASYLSGGFAGFYTKTSTFTTNVTVSANPGSVTSANGLGVCTYLSP
jgi:hypothetical protein